MGAALAKSGIDGAQPLLKLCKKRLANPSETVSTALFAMKASA